MMIEYIKDCSYIKDKAYKNNESLSAVIISEGVKTIGKEAFANCNSLKIVLFPESIKTIAESAFRNSGIKIENQCTAFLAYCIKNSAADMLLGENYIKIYYNKEKGLHDDSCN